MREREEVKHARNKEDLNQTLVWTTVCVCLFRVRSSSGQCCACTCAVQQCFLHPVLRVTEMALPRQHSRKKGHSMAVSRPDFTKCSHAISNSKTLLVNLWLCTKPFAKEFQRKILCFFFFSCPNVLVFIVRCPSCWLVRRVGCKFLGTFDISWC